MPTHPNPYQARCRPGRRRVPAWRRALAAGLAFSLAAPPPSARADSPEQDLATLETQTAAFVDTLAKEKAAHYWVGTAETLDADLEKLEKKAEALAKGAARLPKAQELLDRLIALRPQLIPANCTVSDDLKRDLFKDMRWRDFVALYQAAMYERAAGVFREAKVLYYNAAASGEGKAGWNCVGAFVHADTKVPLTAAQILDLWKKLKDAERLDELKKDLRKLNQRMAQLKSKFLAPGWTKPDEAALELDGLLKNLNQNDLEGLARADPQGFGALVVDMNQVLAHVPARSQSRIQDSLRQFEAGTAKLASSQNPQIQALMRRVIVPSPATDAPSMPSPSANPVADLRATITQVLSGAKADKDAERRYEWLTYNAQKRERLAMRAKSAWNLWIELDLGRPYAPAAAAEILRQYTDAEKIPGVEAREKSLADFVYNVDSIVDESRDRHLTRYRELTAAIKAELDPKKRAPLQDELAALLRDRPAIDRYFAQRLSQAELDALARDRGLDRYAPRPVVTESVAEMAKDLGEPFHVPAWYQGQSYNGRELKRALTESLARLRASFVAAQLPRSYGLWDHHWEKLEDEMRAGDPKARDDYGRILPAIERFKKLIAAVNKVESIRNAEELESTVQWLSEMLGLDKQQASRALASWMMKLFEKEKYPDTRKPDARPQAEKDAALLQARWRAVSAKIDALLKHSKAVGTLNTEEDREAWSEFEREFPESFQALISGLAEQEAKAELLKLENSNPEVYYLLADRFAHLRSSHRGDLLRGLRTSDPASKGFEAALLDIAKRPRPAEPGNPTAPLQAAKLSFLTSIAQVFPQIRPSVERELLVASEDVAVRGTLDGMDEIARRFLGDGEDGRRKLAELERLRVKALGQGGFAERSQAGLDYLRALTQAIRASPAYEKGRAIESAMERAQREFHEAQAASAERFAKSPVMAEWKKKVEDINKSRRASGAAEVSQDEAMGMLADMFGEDAIKEQFKDLAVAVQKYRQATTDLTAEYEAFLKDFNALYPDARRVQDSIDALQAYLSKYAASGRAPPGSWELDTPTGRAKLETAEPGGAPVALSVTADAPYLLRRNYPPGKPVTGYRLTLPGGEVVFQSSDGRLVSKTTVQDGVTKTVYLVNGVPSGTVVEIANAKDPAKPQRTTIHPLPGFPHIQEVGSSDSASRGAKVQLDDLLAIADPAQFEKAVRARAGEVAAYLQRKGYLSEMPDYIIKPEDGWSDSQLSLAGDDPRNAQFYASRYNEHLYYFLAHRVRSAQATKSPLSLDLQKHEGAGRKIQIIEVTGGGGRRVYTTYLTASAASSSDAEWQVEVLSVNDKGEPLAGSHFISYRRPQSVYPQESKYPWIVATTFDHYVSKDVYPLVAIDNRTGQIDTGDAHNVPPWEAFGTHWGYQARTDVYGLTSDGRQEQIPGHTIDGKFRKQVVVDMAGLTVVKEVGGSVLKLGQTVWHGSIGTGKVIISPLAGDDYYIEGMAHFAEAPLSQVTDHWIDVVFGRRPVGDFDKDRWGRKLYEQELFPSEKTGPNGISYEAFRLSAQTSQLLYEAGARQTNDFAKAGLYAAGAFIDFGKGTVETMPLMFAGHFTSGFLRTFGAGKEFAARGGQLVNQGLSYYFLAEMGRGIVHMPGQFNDFIQNPDDPTKAQAFLSSASSLLVNALVAGMMRHAAPAHAPAAPPSSGLGKLLGKLKFIEGSGLEITAQSRNIWGLDMSQFAGGSTITPTMRARVAAVETVLGGKAKKRALTERELAALDAMERALRERKEVNGKALEDAGFTPRELDALAAEGLIPRSAARPKAATLESSLRDPRAQELGAVNDALDTALRETNPARRQQALSKAIQSYTDFITERVGADYAKEMQAIKEEIYGAYRRGQQRPPDAELLAQARERYAATDSGRLLSNARANLELAVRQKLGLAPDEIALFHGVKDFASLEASAGLRVSAPGRSHFGGRGVYTTSFFEYAAEYSTGKGLNGEMPGQSPGLIVTRVKAKDIVEVNSALAETIARERALAKVGTAKSADYMDVYSQELSRAIMEMSKDAPVVRLKGAWGETNRGYDEILIRDPSVFKSAGVEVLNPVTLESLGRPLKVDTDSFAIIPHDPALAATRGPRGPPHPAGASSLLARAKTLLEGLHLPWGRTPPAASQTALNHKALAEEVLGTAISEAQARAIERAHEVGRGELGKDGQTPAAVGNYTPTQIARKARILDEAGFTAQQIRALMEGEVVGDKRAAAPQVAVKDPAELARERAQRDADVRKQAELEARIRREVPDPAQAQRLIEQARHAFEHDVQTGLYKRATFEERAGSIIRAGQDPVVGIMDMNNFGAYNKGLEAHHRGDPLTPMNLGDLALAKSTRRLSALAEQYGVTLGRLGGEEIGIVGERANVQNFLEAARREMQGGRTLFKDLHLTPEQRGDIDAAVAEKRQKIAEELHIPPDKVRIPIGDYTTGLVSAKGLAYHDAIARADAALLWGKRNNRRGESFEYVPGRDGAGDTVSPVQPPSFDVAAYRKERGHRRQLAQRLNELPNLDQQLAELRQRLPADLYSELLAQAAKDDLTGVGTRSHYYANRQAWQAQYRDGGQAVLISPDQFKLINDGLSHAAGDRYLNILGEHMLAQAAESRRTGGDVQTPIRWGQTKDFVVFGRNAETFAASVNRAMIADARIQGILAEYRAKHGETPAGLGQLRIVSHDIRGGNLDASVQDLFLSLEAMKTASR